jgi:hypothetical protein
MFFKPPASRKGSGFEPANRTGCAALSNRQIAQRSTFFKDRSSRRYATVFANPITSKLHSKVQTIATNLTDMLSQVSIGHEGRDDPTVTRIIASALRRREETP